MAVTLPLDCFLYLLVIFSISFTSRSGVTVGTAMNNPKKNMLISETQQADSHAASHDSRSRSHQRSSQATRGSSPDLWGNFPFQYDGIASNLLSTADRRSPLSLSRARLSGIYQSSKPHSRFAPNPNESRSTSGHDIKMDRIVTASSLTTKSKSSISQQSVTMSVRRNLSLRRVDHSEHDLLSAFEGSGSDSLHAVGDYHDGAGDRDHEHGPDEGTRDETAAGGSTSPQPYDKGAAGAETPYSSQQLPGMIPTPSSTVPPAPTSSACSGRSNQISCRLGESISNHILISLLLLVAVCFACYWRLRACCTRNHDQGEYRMVAAQYMESAFDDNFSDAGDGDDYTSDEEEASWARSGKRGIEMKAIEKEVNGGLTLEEMNG